MRDVESAWQVTAQQATCSCRKPRLQHPSSTPCNTVVCSALPLHVCVAPLSLLAHRPVWVHVCLLRLAPLAPRGPLLIQAVRLQRLAPPVAPPSPQGRSPGKVGEASASLQRREAIRVTVEKQIK